MKPFQTVKSRIVPIPIRDVDTDLIIPAQYLTGVTREGYGKHLFKRLREADAAFPLNHPNAEGAEVLVTDQNFGCGSSREHAVWALMDAGIRAIIGKSFADIFYGNAAKNGLLLVTLAPEKVDALLSTGVGLDKEVIVDLKEQTVTLPRGEKVRFEYDAFRKHCLVNGLDDIDYIRSKSDAIASYRARNEALRFVNTLEPAS